MCVWFMFTSSCLTIALMVTVGSTFDSETKIFRLYFLHKGGLSVRVGIFWQYLAAMLFNQHLSILLFIIQSLTGTSTRKIARFGTLPIHTRSTKCQCNRRRSLFGVDCRPAVSLVRTSSKTHCHHHQTKSAFGPNRMIWMWTKYVLRFPQLMT